MRQRKNNKPLDTKVNISMITFDFLWTNTPSIGIKVVHNKTDCQTIWQTIFPDRLEKIKHNHIFVKRRTYINV